MTATDRMVPVRDDLSLHVRHWEGEERPFVLLHGLASNCRTWEAVARSLAAAGHRVITVDQRGHGASDKADTGYDFVTVADDLMRLLDALELERPLVVGQSWGGNVVLAFGARYSGRAGGLGFVDGGFLDLQDRPDATWPAVAQQLRPPALDGMVADELRARIRQANPEWSEEGIEATLANFEILPDGRLRRHLPVDKHMLIVRALWDQRPGELYPLVREPVLICPAAGEDIEWTRRKRRQVAAAAATLSHCEVHWFENTHHDIHIHRPAALVEVMVNALSRGIWSCGRSAG